MRNESILRANRVGTPWDDGEERESERAREAAGEEREVTMGPVEALVLRAWGHGTRIDAGDHRCPAGHADALCDVLTEARSLDVGIPMQMRYGCLGCPMVSRSC